MAAATTRAKAVAKADEDTPAVDAIWLKLQTENAIPPLKFATLTFPEPTRSQIEAWRASTNVEEGELGLWGAELRDAVHALFDHLPNHIWENFNVLYLKHFFGAAGDEDLKD